MRLRDKQIKRLDGIRRSGAPIIDELPEGWRLMGVYCGDYQWANNGRSRFKTGYEHALVRMEDNDGD